MQEKEQYELRMLMHRWTVCKVFASFTIQNWQKRLWMAVRNANIRVNA